VSLKKALVSASKFGFFKANLQSDTSAPQQAVALPAVYAA
jgi:hypothetical protein